MNETEAKAIREVVEGLMTCGQVVQYQLDAASRVLQAAAIFTKQLEEIAKRDGE